MSQWRIFFSEQNIVYGESNNYCVPSRQSKCSLIEYIVLLVYINYSLRIAPTTQTHSNNPVSFLWNNWKPPLENGGFLNFFWLILVLLQCLLSFINTSGNVQYFKEENLHFFSSKMYLNYFIILYHLLISL